MTLSQASLDGCLVVTSNGESWLVAWPRGTSWDEVTGTVIVDDAAVRVGDDIELSGGEYESPDRVDESEWLTPPSAGLLSLEKLWWATGITG